MSTRNEFDLINDIKSRYNLDHIGDDCAVVPKDAETDLLLTADLLLEDIDFRLDWTTPEFLGRKALSVSLSDIAAMGGTPKWAMLSIGVPESLWKTDLLDRFYEGWHAVARDVGVELIGGDISRSPDKLVIDSIAGGEVPRGRAILRSGSRSADAIVVTGQLGGSAGGLKLLENGRHLSQKPEEWEEKLIRKHLNAEYQIEAIWLQKNKLANAMIDLSDGLSSDLAHICRASKLGAKIFAEKVPLDPDLARLTNSFDEQLDLALNGGEDYQLLFTVPPERVCELAEMHRFTVIGEMTGEPERIEIVRDGVAGELAPNGFRHF